MKLLNLLTELHNWVTDKDFVWWPFSFLRPPANEPITAKLVVLMTACFGGLAFTLFTAFAVLNGVFSLISAFLTLASCFLSFYLWFNFITRPLWNRRTRDLAGPRRK